MGWHSFLIVLFLTAYFRLEAKALEGFTEVDSVFNHSIMWLDGAVGDAVHVNWNSSSRLYWKDQASRSGEPGFDLVLETVVEIPEIGELKLESPYPHSKLAKSSDGRFRLESLVQRRVQTYTLFHRREKEEVPIAAGLSLEILRDNPVIVIHPTCMTDHARLELDPHGGEEPLFIGIECSQDNPRVLLPEFYKSILIQDGEYALFQTNASNTRVGKLFLEKARPGFKAEASSVHREEGVTQKYSVGLKSQQSFFEGSWADTRSSFQLAPVMTWRQRDGFQELFRASLEFSFLSTGQWNAQAGFGLLPFMSIESRHFNLLLGGEFSVLHFKNEDVSSQGGPWLALELFPYFWDHLYSFLELRPFLWFGEENGGGAELKLRLPSSSRLMQFEVFSKAVCLKSDRSFVSIGIGINRFF